MNDEVLVKVDKVSKKFCRTLKRSLWYGVQDVVGEVLGRSGERDKLRSDEFWSVKDISFELRRGECLGLIGPNGAGKSTLLKMLNGLITPDQGSISMRGRVGALIELGAGFNPILTGRENIYINGSVLGFTKEELDKNLDAIIAFAELEEFIDSPVQNYSSGMKVRLGFAVAAQMDPDVLIIDEVLAVGDAGFRVKCYNRIDELSENAAIIFVSHSMQHVSRLASTVIVLNKGKCAFAGFCNEGVGEYGNLFKSTESGRHGNGQININNILFNNTVSPENLIYGESLRIDVELDSNIINNDVIVDVLFYNMSSELVAECNNFVEKCNISFDDNKRYKVSVVLPKNYLNPGSYQVSVVVANSNMLTHYDWWRGIAKIKVTGARPATSGVQMLGEWTVVEV